MVDKPYIILLAVTIAITAAYVFFVQSYDIFSKAVEILIIPYSNFDVLWFLLPIYFNWILSEVFFEYMELRFARLFSNGFTLMWIALGLIKYLLQTFVLDAGWIIKLTIGIFITIYGGFVFVNALRGKKIIRYLGRSRELFFVVIFVTPFFFDLLVFDVTYLLSGLIVFVTMNGILAILQRVVPQFGGEKADIQEESAKI